MGTRFLTEKDKSYLIQLFGDYSKEVDDKLTKLADQSYSKEDLDKKLSALENRLYFKEYIDKKLLELENRSYSKEAIDKMFEDYDPGFEAVFYTEHGVGYTPHMVIDSETIIGGAWYNANELISLELTNWNPTSANDVKLADGASANDTFRSSSLKTLILPKLQYGGHYWARYTTALETVQLGSVGFPVTSLGNYFFYRDTQENLTITVYVDATTLSGITSAVKGTAPWGATNATVIYRNSNTGEIITQS